MEDFQEVISLELASAIFGEEVDYVDASIIIKKEGEFLPIRFKEGNYHEFPLTFLAQKCKEWALRTFEYTINSNINGVAIANSTYYYDDSESEAIFLACEALLKHF